MSAATDMVGANARRVLHRARAAGRGVLSALATPLDVADPLIDIQQATRAHRRTHRCGAYTYGDGSLPATLAAAVGARRIVEVGTALGYTAASMAHAVPMALVDTIEMDAVHVDLAREQIERHGLSERVRVVHGDAAFVLTELDSAAYDLAFFDGFTPTLDVVVGLYERLRPGGLLVAGNMILRPRRDVTEHLADPSLWLTHSLGETALCVKR